MRTRRDSKGFSFLEVNDGSCLKNLQVVIDHSVVSAGDLKRMTTGCSVKIVGDVVESPGKKTEMGSSGKRGLYSGGG